MNNIQYCHQMLRSRSHSNSTRLFWVDSSRPI